MSRTWLYSDPHFYHGNICKFTKEDGSKLRPWDDANQMTEEMIQWYNELVRPDDRVYMLGDVAFTASAIRSTIPRMNGRICLIPGNHEPVKMRKYFDVFDDVRGYVQRQGFIMSHIPIHSGSLGRWKLNIHGHLHANRVEARPRVEIFPPVYNKRYRCVSVEQTGFRPIELDQVLTEEGLK